MTTLARWLCATFTGHRWPTRVHGRMACTRCGQPVQTRSDR